ncbi:PIG-L deacetylase family protein [Draconibacterium halophilum]|uniref:PIG-L family deacetylase n=1 Tax=Draconibacterium halophilum TaxID=2706887 RepID=A0A6C0RDB0_9BACT|nr:PIG-L deacetylase family protein [Draconibacterium halophilum]QIA08638.1 PIG-L family deacetylase [Draconibacterium halophilum]
MKILILFLLSLFFAFTTHAQNSKINVVVIGAHPDDADVDVAGTAYQFAQMGHNVLFVSLTNGDAGHYNKGGGALAKIRIKEAEEAGKRIGVTYKVLDNHDAELMPTLKLRHDIIRIIRNWNADVVITHRPYDYHPDHRNTAIAVQDAAFLVTVPNVAPDVSALKVNPVFLFSHDNFQKPNPFQPDIAVDISAVYDKKVYGMAAHESQFFEWLPWLNGKLEEVPDNEQDRLEWLGKMRLNTPTPAMRKSLEKWYDAETAEKAQAVEAFEICEFGRHPSDEDIKMLFPMLGK